MTARAFTANTALVAAAQEAIALHEPVSRPLTGEEIYTAFRDHAGALSTEETTRYLALPPSAAIDHVRAVLEASADSYAGSTHESRAASALRPYRDLSDPAAMLRDLLTDLRHYAQIEGLDFEHEAALSFANFCEEDGEPDEVLTKAAPARRTPSRDHPELNYHGALCQIAELYPYPHECKQQADQVYGINDGKNRSILLQAALDIARQAIGTAPAKMPAKKPVTFVCVHCDGDYQNADYFNRTGYCSPACEALNRGRR